MAAQEPALAAIVGPVFARMSTTLAAQGYGLVLDWACALSWAVSRCVSNALTSPVGVSARVSGPAGSAGPDTLWR
jgi:hypothetical protein